MSHHPERIEFRQSTSSVFARLDPDLRRQVDRAIVRRQPPTLAAVFETLQLAARGISRSAFYRYAARLRRHAELFQFADYAGLEAPTTTAAILTVLANRLIDAAVDDEVPTQVLSRLARTQQLVAATEYARERLRSRAVRCLEQAAAMHPAAPAPAAPNGQTATAPPLRTPDASSP
jgi:maltooligosyltrehalose synthase